MGNVAAGSPILAQECIEDYLTFDTGGRDGEYFALRVRGESMINAGILPDDLVVVHQQPAANNGEIVVALLGASWAADHLTEPVAQWIEPRVTQRVEQKIEESHAADAGQMLQALSFRGDSLQKLLDTVSQRVQETGESLIRAVSLSVARSVASTAVYVVVFLILLVLLFFIGRAVGIARSRRRLPDHPAQMEPPQSPAEPEPVPETPESVPEPVPEPEVPAASEETPVPPVIVPESAPAEEAPAPEAVTPPEEEVPAEETPAEETPAEPEPVPEPEPTPEAPEEPEDKPQTLDRDSLDALLEEIRNMEP